MCGIIGYLGDEPAGPIIYHGLENLEYRGYDSAGIALANGEMTIEKRTGEVANLPVPEADATLGIGHTRWSTHGPPTDTNAHPHVDCEGRIAVVHNGIIENHDALRAELDGHAFTSETDTEVIPHLLEDALAAGASLREAVAAVAERLEGSYAFVAISLEERAIVATRDGSPLVVGHGDDGSGFVASDVPAFLEHTQEVTYLTDGDVAAITDDGVAIYRDGRAVDLEIERVTWDAESAEKGGYEHYMRKEIHEQPQALRQTIAERIDLEGGTVDLDIDFPVGYLDSLEEVQLVAAGTSYYAALYGAHLIEELAEVRTNVTIASEYAFGAGRDPWRMLAIAVTQSGETKDTLDAIAAADAAGAPTLAVTNVLGSSITRSVDDTVFIRAGPEIGVASTKAFSSQVVTLILLAVAMGRERGTLTRSAARDILEDLNGLPGAVQRVLDREDEVAETAETYLDAESYFFVGRHIGYPVALEGALKLKEISYDHAEGFAAGELKHGPLALVTERAPVIAVMTEGTRPTATLHNVAEAQTRGAPAIGIVSEGFDAGTMDTLFEVDAVGLAEPLVANVVLQLFAYHTAKLEGRPIDKPRNLAKSVTVG